MKPKEFVVIIMRPCPEWLFLAFGVMFAGARIVPICSTNEGGLDLIALMKKLKTCCMLAFDPGYEGEIWHVVENIVEHFKKDGSANSKNLPSLRYLIGHAISDLSSNIKTVKDMLKEDTQSVELPPVDPKDIFVVLYTTGSTGNPKLVAHTHSVLAYRNFISKTDSPGKINFFNNRPFNWVGGFPSSVMHGQTRVTISRFARPAADPLGRVIEVIQEEKCNRAFLLPSIVSELVKRKVH